MSTTVCLAPTGTLGYAELGGGHLWAYLNWALGLRALGQRVLWLEWLPPGDGANGIERLAASLDAVLAAHGVTLVLGTWDGEPLPPSLARRYAPLPSAWEADLLLNFRYGLQQDVVARFRRSALVDIDPGLLQIWMTDGQMPVARHDHYFTIGETIGRAASRCPHAGVSWHHTRPPVFLAEWPPTAAPVDAPYTTVSTWWGPWLKWGDESSPNDKRTSFLEFAALPARTTVPLELALCLAGGDANDERDRRQLERLGWRVRHAWEVAATTADYRRYVQRSRGEWSCAKPWYVKLGNAWLSDRTLCYLASGKPAVVQDTGPSAFLPDACGLWRFRDLDGAARCLEAVEADYEGQCREARALAERCFDARVIVRTLLEVALD